MKCQVFFAFCFCRPSGNQPAAGVDYTELNKQIAIAKGIDPAEYNSVSRDALAAALKAAEEALSSKDQSAVSAAAQNLKNAMDGLKKMDYSALQSALARADVFLVSDQTAVLWQKLSDAARKGIGLLESGDQTAVDAVAVELTTLLDALKEELELIQETQVVVKEVPVETLPTNEFYLEF